jgi:hypothetical protein
MQKGGPKVALSLAPDRRSYAAPATSRRARRAAGMSRTPSPFTTNVAGCKATWDALASKSQTSSAAALSSRSIHSRSSIRGPMHDASRAAHTRAECSSWSRKSRQSLLPRREPGELVANPIGFDFDFERAREVRDRSPQVRLASAAGRTGRPRLPTPSRWPHASQQAGNALGERQGSAVARAGDRGAGGRGQGGSPGRENRAHTTARRLTSTVIGPPPLRRRPRD